MENIFIQKLFVKDTFAKKQTNKQKHENMSSRPGVFCKKGWGFIKKENLTQVFSCEFCEIFQNAFFIEHLW